MSENSNTDTRPIERIRKTSRRIIQFATSTIIVASITIAIDLFFKVYMSALIDFAIIIVLVVLVVLTRKGYVKLSKILTVIFMNLLIIALMLAEGKESGDFLYFIPLVFAIPFVVDDIINYGREMLLYFVITLFCFAFCILYLPAYSNLQHLDESTLRVLYYTNCFTSFTLSAVFAYLGLRFEQQYASELIRQKKNVLVAADARNRFLSIMGHELRTPLNGIIGTINLLKEAHSTEERDEYIQILKYSSDHMLTLVNDVLDFNKIEAGKLELHFTPVNLNELLLQSAATFKPRFIEKNISFQLAADPLCDTFILADQLRLQQVLNNILSNALKFTDSGGHVVCRAVIKNKSTEAVHACFSISDTGIGIESNVIQKIFDGFWQADNQSNRSYAGTGLGLSISQRLLHLMNSNLEVNSTPGKGSTFSFCVNFVPAAQVVKKPAHLNGSATLEGMHIFVAEDNDVNKIVIRRMLEAQKAKITIAGNGEELLNILKTDSSAQIILLDLEMPVMDGYKAFNEIKQLYPQIPVIAFTAALMDNDMYTKLIHQGFKDCMLKPFEPADLFAKIKKYATILP